MAVSTEILRVLSDLDPETQMTVLRWAQAKVRRRSRKESAPVYSRERHSVTLGERDADIQQWGTEGLSLRSMASRLECSIRCVTVRAKKLREKASGTNA